MRTEPLVAEVVVDVPARETDKVFDYLVPDELAPVVEAGSRVQVEFGTRKRVGYVVGLKRGSRTTRLKEILDVMDLLPPLTPELVRLGLYMAEEYVCRVITAFTAMVPAVLKGKYRRVVVLRPEASDKPESLLSLSAESLFQVLSERAEVDVEEALKLPGITPGVLRELEAEGRIALEERVGDRSTHKRVVWVKPADVSGLEEAMRALPARAIRQREILRRFSEHPEEVSLPELLRKTGASRQTVKSLVSAGVLLWEERESYRDPSGGKPVERTEPLPLTDEQASALAAIREPLRKGRFHSVLLHGVTGSGKTEVYLQAIEEALRLQRESIVLVPEISLTPQMVKRFKGRFGDQVAVLHSGLSAGERYDEWRKIRRGEVKVAIGARSAVFAPFRRLGLIIIDEEHESSYKQEENPKYHAREIAKWRAREHGAVLVLGSATPSLESYVAARTGGHEWVRLEKRVHGRPLPRIEVVDLREELRTGNRSMFSGVLRREIEGVLRREEQAVLFLNRRGFSTFVMCRECGESLMCPHCDISLTFHRTNRTVRCHYCGHAEPVPAACPGCGSRHIRHFGAGTQRVEEELTRLFPGIRVIRMDVDTTGTKGAHERLLSAFGEGRADVLLGTQMIAKGLDFPGVTLVGVIAADTMLHLPDFRASERTFQLLTQVSGRAGRHERPGKVVIQTYSPEHYSIALAAAHRTEEFYREEGRLRKRHDYPPFCGLFTILLSHPDRVKLLRAGQELARFIGGRLPGDCRMLGPVPAPVPRINDRYRLQLIIRHPSKAETADPVKSILRKAEGLLNDPELRIQLDRDGVLP
ncbi:primosomal protein N' [Staphylospora marina]|uniref:primosomal protein N' n=1 Tax=Staphylospora marina TaxID=2490858 RepID=UPI000F5BA317|nr:primosomal protein N' [Staphylospora marina]